MAQDRHGKRPVRLLALAVGLALTLPFAALTVAGPLHGGAHAGLAWCSGWRETSSSAPQHDRAAAFAGQRSAWGPAATEPSRVGSRRASLTAAVPAFLSATSTAWRVAGVSALALLLAIRRVKVWLETPSRPYVKSDSSNSVRAEYDQWTREGVLEHYWGEHIHMGSYSSVQDQKGYNRNDSIVVAFLRATLRHLVGGYKNFIDAKLDFSKEMLAWSGATKPKRILDVGCGIGGTSRFLARAFPEAEILGITLSPEQVARATALAREAGLTNVRFEVANALDMPFEDGTFDLVWGCESGEHMPDKRKYVEEMSRVLAPGGNLVIAVWCERDPVPTFTNEERTSLKFLYEEWSHPYFISINAFGRLLEETGHLDIVVTDDWTEQTLPSWRHSVWVGVWSPWYWMKVTAQRPKAFLGFVRDAYTLERYHRAMKRGLLTYGMMKARKKA